MDNKTSAAGFFTARNVATLGILIALTIVLQLFASAVPIGPITLNFSLIPMALAAMILGAAGGGIVGFASGLVTFINCALLGREPFTAYLFQQSPVILTAVCFGKTTVAGIAAGFIFAAIRRFNVTAGAIVSSIALPVINTGLYMLGMVIMYPEVSAYMSIESGAGVVFAAVFAVIWLNFVLEVVVSAICSPALATVIRVVEKNYRKKKSVGNSAKKEADEPVEETAEPVEETAESSADEEDI